ncbi:MAG: dihydroorotate dehydrogenase electron transfer subunit [Desulfobacterales bacterium]|nr:dihydroorotate dehydrogenase electron transfer subunit [Desulfobacterales bacterium]
MILADGKIVWNRSLGETYRCMGITADAGYAATLPGQFVMVKLDSGYAPLLRRPFSIHRLIDSGEGVAGIELLYKMVGPTTVQMGGLRPGDTLSLLGPLGRGFTAAPGPVRVALVGGGIGIAPLVFLSSWLIAQGFAPDFIRIFLGGRSDADLLCVNDFNKLGLRVSTTTDDGSAGEKGLVTGPLERALAAGDIQMVYACGPVGMLKGVAALAEKYKVACQVSIETIMACGMGACMGCVVKGKDSREDKRRHACLDGPVFEAGQITLDH